MDFDADGEEIMAENVDPDARESRFVADGSGSKVDYSNYAPVPFQKTATLVNYFITNTAQFLNTFT